MYAVIATGGKQYRVATGDVIRVEKLDADAGSTVTFDRVLLLGEGEDVRIGQPFLDGETVQGTVKAHVRGDKIEIIKIKRRKNHRKHMGHRQDYTEVEITAMAGGAKKKTTKKAAPKKAAAKKTAKKKKATKKKATRKAAPKKAAAKKKTAKKKAAKKTRKK